MPISRMLDRPNASSPADHASRASPTSSSMQKNVTPAIMEKLQMHWTSHMDQYDVLSHPQSQSLLPYLISSQPRDELVHKSQGSGPSMMESEKRARINAEWTPNLSQSRSHPGLHGTGPYGKDPLWRSQQISYLHSKQQQQQQQAYPSVRHDPYGAVRVAPDEQGNPRHFHWYRRDFRNMARPNSGRFSPLHHSVDYIPPRRPMEMPHRMPYLPMQETRTTPAEPELGSSSAYTQRYGDVDESQRGVIDPAAITSVDKDLVTRYIPGELTPLFDLIQTKQQPHLDKLRVRKRNLEDALATGNMSLSEDAELIIQESKNKRKAGNQGLLTEAEKKANHIASEQKRRANIRKGYDMLSAMLPTLSKYAESQGGSGDVKRNGEEDGMDSRSSIHSEITVLEEGMYIVIDTDHTAIEYVTQCLQEHHQLLLRKSKAQEELLAYYRRMAV